MARRKYGELEGEVLAVMWSADEALTPEEVRQRLGGRLAYTTVLTILSRLWQKGQLDRRPRGRAFEYSPVESEGEFGATQLVEALNKIGDRSSALSHFVGRLSAAETRQLRSALDHRGRKK